MANNSRITSGNNEVCTKQIYIITFLYTVMLNPNFRSHNNLQFEAKATNNLV